MKVWLAVIVLLSGWAFSASWREVEESATRLVQIIELELGVEAAAGTYLPGYGFHVNVPAIRPQSDDLFDEVLGLTPPIGNVKRSLVSIVQDLNVLVKGLGPAEWVSVRYDDGKGFLIIRMRSNQPDSLEVWIDGVKQ